MGSHDLKNDGVCPAIRSLFQEGSKRLPLKTDFDFSSFNVEEEEHLKDISTKIKEKAASIGEQMMEIGQYLHEAKKALREDGKLFSV